ncbi:MAG: 4-hydroxy-tetrahydrodipicolinate reductase [Lachnospiraceae bacterium]|nr:4-hydroxy-tetrahydrodipicolinate reductase [Lachnospiraceae bacterium]
MTKVIMHGCNGKMGQTITRLIETDEAIEIAAGVDVYDGISNTYPVFKNIAECDVEADVVIDFSSPVCMDALLDYCADKKVPVVLCTTGLTKAQLDKVQETSKKVAVLKSANMSMGINLLQKVLKDISPILAEAGFDIEIVEKHHNLKKDSPSGTALALGDSINEAFEEKFEYVYDRSDRSIVRPKQEIGFSAVRGGTIVGDHDVIFAGEDEVITLSHRAYSKAVFGKGAVQAAKFLKGKAAGMYDMSDVINA